MLKPNFAFPKTNTFMDVITSSPSVDIAALNDKIGRESAFIDVLNLELGKAVVGQKYMVERLILAVFCLLYTSPSPRD